MLGGTQAWQPAHRDGVHTYHRRNTKGDTQLTSSYVSCSPGSRMNSSNGTAASGLVPPPPKPSMPRKEKPLPCAYGSTRGHTRWRGPLHTSYEIARGSRLKAGVNVERCV